LVTLEALSLSHRFSSGIVLGPKISPTGPKQARNLPSLAGNDAAKTSGRERDVEKASVREEIRAHFSSPSLTFQACTDKLGEDKDKDREVIIFV